MTKEYAFPNSTSICTTQSGMTLRDYFAAAAMQGLIEAESFPGHIFGRNDVTESIARTSYNLADAMLAERKDPSNEK